jgi:hypothetical protein
LRHLVYALLVLAACGGKKQPASQAGGPAAAAAVDPTRAGTDPEELLRALHQPHAALLKAVGPHKLTVKSTLKAAGETLDEDVTLSVDDKGDFHLVHDNSRDYGKEVILIGDDLYIRPRYGKLVQRPAEKGEGYRLRDEAYGTLAAYLDVVGHALAAKSFTKGTTAGKPSLEVVLGVASEPRKIEPASADHPERKWRETVTAGTIEGTVTLDEATAVPLAANLKLGYKFVRDGQPIDTELTLTMAVEPADEKIAPPAPDAYVQIPSRPRPTLERDQLLGKTGADDGGTP